MKANDELRAMFEAWVKTTSGWKACMRRGKPNNYAKLLKDKP